MAKEKNVIKTLKGEDLFYYLTHCIEDKEYSELVELLTLAIPDRQKALSFLEKMIQEDKHLAAVYPGNEEEPSPGMILVGPIPDGSLYVI